MQKRKKTQQRRPSNDIVLPDHRLQRAENLNMALSPSEPDSDKPTLKEVYRIGRFRKISLPRMASIF